MIDELKQFAFTLLQACRDILPIAAAFFGEALQNGGMIDSLIQFALSLLETCRNVLPISTTIIGFQLLIIRRPIAHPRKILFGFISVLLGIVFFLKGLDMALFPLGELMASQLTVPEFLGVEPLAGKIDWRDYAWIYVFAVIIGFTTALAEPALLAVALKAEKISGGTIRAWGLRFSVAFGVGFGIALGAFRIVTGAEFYIYIVAGYLVVMVQTRFAPKLILGLAFDSGAVTTSMVTVPMITALGLGLAEAVPGRNPLVDGFGLIAFASLFPVIAVLGYAQIAQWFNKDKPSSKS